MILKWRATYVTTYARYAHISNGLEIGRVAVRLAKERISDGRQTALRVKVASEMIVRDSVEKNKLL